MLPFLTYSNTIVYTPHYFFLIAVVYAIARKPVLTSYEYKNHLFVNIIVIILLSSINFLVHYLLDINRSEILPYTILMLGSYAIAIALTPQDLKILVYLVTVECLFAYAEFIFGVKTFFTGIENYAEARDTELLYFKSVYGLSENSSAFSIKVILAYLLTYFLNMKGARSVVIRLILWGGLLVSFNRTSFLVVLFFHAWQFSSIFYRSILQFMALKIKRQLLNALIIGILLLLAFTYSIVDNFSVIRNQFTRGTQGIELTGREVIWSKFITFISEHPFFGNGSFKYYADYHEGPIHAHNSFLQVLATHGVIIFAFHILLILMNLRKENIIFVAPLIMYSLAQYGVFWGVSFTDIVFFVFLLYRRAGSWGIEPQTQNLMLSLETPPGRLKI